MYIVFHTLYSKIRTFDVFCYFILLFTFCWSKCAWIAYVFMFSSLLLKFHAHTCAFICKGTVQQRIHLSSSITFIRKTSLYMYIIFYKYQRSVLLYNIFKQNYTFDSFSIWFKLFIVTFNQLFSCYLKSKQSVFFLFNQTTHASFFLYP